jgi:hypothetical protein
MDGGTALACGALTDVRRGDGGGRDGSEPAAEDCRLWWFGTNAGELNSLPGSIGDAVGETMPSWMGNERGLVILNGDDG